MIVYYSMSGTTRQYAEVLSELLQEPAFELKEKKPKSGVLGKAIGAAEAFLNLPAELEAMPELLPGRAIFLCSPVWAGGLTPAAKTFLKNAGAGKRKVNVILTCDSPLNHERYKKAVTEQIILSHYAPGFVQVYTRKAGFDRSVVLKHLKKLVLKVDRLY